MTPVHRDSRGAVIACDGDRCRRTLSCPGTGVGDEVDLDRYPGWRWVVVEGWVGEFVACSEQCERSVRERAGSNAP